MLKEIFKSSLKNLKQNWLTIIGLCFILVLVGVLIFSCDLLSFGIGIIILLPFVFMPTFFAIQTSIYGLRKEAFPSWRLFFRFFISYFKVQFRGCYRYIWTFLMSVLIVMVTNTIFGYVAEVVCYSIYPNFNTIIEELYQALSNLDISSVYVTISGEEISTFLYISYLPSFGLGLIYFFISLSFNSFYVYFRIDNLKVVPNYARLSYRIAKNQIRTTLIKEFWCSNFPIFILLIIGFIGGTLLGYYLNYNVLQGVAFALILALSGALLYFPFYFSNMETIYLRHFDLFKNAPELAKQFVMSNLQNELKIINRNISDLQNAEQDNNHEILNDDKNQHTTDNINNDNNDNNNNNNDA